MVGIFFDWLRTVLIMAGYVTGSAAFPKPLDAEEEREYIALMGEGDENARNILIERNLRLVAHIAKKYADEKNLEDLISIGTIGLIKGVNTFKPEKNNRISSYIARCIENEILMTMRSSKRLNNEISMEESIGVDKDGNNMTFLDILVPDEGDIADEISDRIEAKRLYDAMDAVLSTDEKKIMCWRYGLHNTKRKTQREIADILGISRSYVSRIEKRCLKRLFDVLNDG
ncbi:MAG: RNA polymerase sporulation sigma factor SigK [Clostridiales bacterium]|nr:RNA polymerase sporulation sigma factor SigK [Clostridiales bacterium]